MANHITLSSFDGDIVIVDKSRIIACTPFLEIDTEAYNKSMKEHENQLRLWRDKQTAAFLSENRHSMGAWTVNNPAPEEPERSSFATGKKLTRVELANKTSLIVNESTDEIFSKIKEGDSK